MNKVIKDGKVAVLVSPGFGAGFTTWNHNEGLSPFEPKIVNMILEGRLEEIDEDWIKDNLGVDTYGGGIGQLEIEWIPQGVSFSINEYDGSESIYRSDDLKYTA